MESLTDEQRTVLDDMHDVADRLHKLLPACEEADRLVQAVVIAALQTRIFFQIGE